MKPGITKIIDQYLNNELSETDRAAFEKRLSSSDELQSALGEQRNIVDGIKRSTDRLKTQNKIRSIKTKIRLKWFGGSILVIGIAAVVIWQVFYTGIRGISEEVRERMNDQKELFELDAEYFQIPNDGALVMTISGVLLSFDPESFTLNGEPYTGEVYAQYQEAQHADDILAAGLSTMSGDNLLETQGMFSVQAYSTSGDKLELKKDKSIYVQVPVNEVKSGMELYQGERKADGAIDWVEPRPIEKKPVLADMKDLDFYPKDYEPYLNEIKWKQGKSARDSLYLTFDCYSSNDVSNQSKLSGQQLFESLCATCHRPTLDGTGPKLKGVRDQWEKGGALPGSIYTFVRSWQEAAMFDDYATLVSKKKPTAMSKFPELSDSEIDAILDYCDSHSDYSDQYSIAEENIEEVIYEAPFEYDTIFDEAPSVNGASAAASEGVVETAMDEACGNYVQPSSVLAFWDPKMNNTNLATRDFEKRMQAIHRTCNNDILEKYTSQLDKPLSEIDQQVADMGYQEFTAFANEGVGKINLDNAHAQRLQSFYESSIKRLKDLGRKAKKREVKRRAKWDEVTEKSREKELKRRTWREQQAYKEEYNFNLNNVKKQMGSSVGFDIQHGDAPVLNIDAQVAIATRNRETTTIVNPITGETAEIKYNDFTVSVANASNYGKLFAYFFPSEINSFQRVDAKNGEIKFSLNEAMIYDMAIVGINDEGYHYFQRQSFKAGKMERVKLKYVSEVEFKASLKQIDRKLSLIHI